MAWGRYVEMKGEERNRNIFALFISLYFANGCNGTCHNELYNGPYVNMPFQQKDGTVLTTIFTQIWK